MSRVTADINIARKIAKDAVEVNLERTIRWLALYIVYEKDAGYRADFQQMQDELEKLFQQFAGRPYEGVKA
jgi:hypothetical protein